VRRNLYVRTKMSPQIGATFLVVRVIEVGKKFSICGVQQDVLSDVV